jgi:hypothetical protein
MRKEADEIQVNKLDQADELIKEADLMMSFDDNEAAKELYTSAINLYCEVRGTVTKGLAAVEPKQLSRATKNLADAYIKRGCIYMRAHSHNEAKTDCDNAKVLMLELNGQLDSIIMLYDNLSHKGMDDQFRIDCCRNVRELVRSPNINLRTRYSGIATAIVEAHARLIAEISDQIYLNASDNTLHEEYRQSIKEAIQLFYCIGKEQLTENEAGRLYLLIMHSTISKYCPENRRYPELALECFLTALQNNIRKEVLTGNNHLQELCDALKKNRDLLTIIKNHSASIAALELLLEIATDDFGESVSKFFKAIISSNQPSFRQQLQNLLDQCREAEAKTKQSPTLQQIKTNNVKKSSGILQEGKEVDGIQRNKLEQADALIKEAISMMVLSNMEAARDLCSTAINLYCEVRESATKNHADIDLKQLTKYIADAYIKRGCIYMHAYSYNEAKIDCDKAKQLTLELNGKLDSVIMLYYHLSIGSINFLRHIGLTIDCFQDILELVTKSSKINLKIVSPYQNIENLDCRTLIVKILTSLPASIQNCHEIYNYHPDRIDNYRQLIKKAIQLFCDIGNEHLTEASIHKLYTSLYAHIMSVSIKDGFYEEALKCFLGALQNGMVKEELKCNLEELQDALKKDQGLLTIIRKHPAAIAAYELLLAGAKTSFREWITSSVPFLNTSTHPQRLQESLGQCKQEEQRLIYKQEKKTKDAEKLAEFLLKSNDSIKVVISTQQFLLDDATLSVRCPSAKDL